MRGEERGARVKERVCGLVRRLRVGMKVSEILSRKGGEPKK